MREFKFRAWQRENDPEIPIVPDREDCILMQYTGIKDKNGKEIYEGDILKYETGYMDSVTYEDGCFMTTGNSSCDYLHCSVGRYHPVVVGNIYENPELLN